MRDRGCMIRGLFTGIVSVVLFGIWLHRQATTAPVLLHRVMPSDAVKNRATVHVESLMSTIERESPWILKPNAKPSNNSLVQS